MEAYEREDMDYEENDKIVRRKEGV
jgi:hypothetical protein